MLTPIQNRLLEMLKWFHKYCEDNNITYYAAGGTMIGAARHAGFIPWDDDIDLVLPRKDYNKLISLFTKQENHYFLETPYTGNADYLCTFAKLYDTNTTLIECARKKCKRGIYIDIFPLDSIGNSIKEARLNFRRFDRKNMFLMTRTCAIRKERSWYKNFSIILARLIPSFLIDEKKLSINLDKLANSINEQHSSNSTYVANLNGTYRDKEIIEHRFFGKPTLYQFEDTQIYGPQCFDEYLTYIYGNWRELPPKEKQKTAHDYIEMNLEKSYIEE